MIRASLKGGIWAGEVRKSSHLDFYGLRIAKVSKVRIAKAKPQEHAWHILGNHWASEAGVK